jgi:hypothetical protein
MAENEELSYPALSGRAWRVDGDWPTAASMPIGFTRGDFLVCRGAVPPHGVEAAAALRAAGVAAVIASSIPRELLAAAIEAGLPAVAIEEAAAILSGDRLRVDIETYRVANRNSGDRYIIKNLDDASLERLRLAAEAGR